MLTICLVFVFSVVAICNGHGRFRNFIPNGYSVPNPCTDNPTDLWARVGHVVQDFRQDVKKEKTQFGNDFGAARTNLLQSGLGENQIWEMICNMDSDGDGRTNGAELGDPDCSWRSNATTPVQTKGLTHPGIPEDPNGQVTKEARLKFC